MQPVVVRRFHDRAQRLDGRKRILELHQLAGRDTTRGDARTDALQVADLSDLLAHGLRKVGIAREQLHHVEAAFDLLHAQHGHGRPALQQTPSHRRERAVDHIRKAAPAAAVRGEELQVADGEFVDPHEVVLVQPRKGGDVGDVAMLGEFEVVKHRARGRNAVGELIDTETLERAGAELTAELLAVHLLREYPVVEAVGVVSRAESLGETILASPSEEHLLGCEVRHQFVHIGIGALGHIELAGGDVEKGHARIPAPEVHRSQVGVLLVGQYVVAERHARGHQLNHTAFDQSLDCLRVFELLAHRHPLARPHQFGQVGVDGMVGKTSQFDIRRGTVRTARERNAENAARLDGVFAERLVKVAHAEEQNRVGMHRLDRIVLLHQRRLHVFLFYCQDNKIL